MSHRRREQQATNQRRATDPPEENLEAIVATIAANATPNLPRREGVRLWKQRLSLDGRQITEREN